MASPRSAIVPYRAGADGQMRPYLWLVLTGPRGGRRVLISGLVDTGADRSVLPIDYAQKLGYAVDDLAPAEIGQVEGSASAWFAQKPCQAFVDGISDTKFEIEPLFVAGLNALWGRADLMMNFRLGISEKDRELTLQPE